MSELRDSINQLCRFLAVRDFSHLDKAELKKESGFDKADVLMVFGNELTYVIETAAHALQIGLSDHLLFCGGIGHGTFLLRRNVSGDKRYGLPPDQIAGLSEAEISREVAMKHGGILKEQILVETVSTNCGENSRNGIELLKERGLSMDRIILMQDPLMQRRSCESLKRCVPGDSRVLNYASFIPEVDDELNYVRDMPPAWDEDRFFTLILGEISRLRDDEKGYGPKGKKFIGHVEIPQDIEAAYRVVAQHCPSYGNRIL